MSTTTTLTILLSEHAGKIVLEVKKGGVIVVDLPKKHREALQRASIAAGYGLQVPPMRNLGVSYQLGKQTSLQIGSELRIFIRQTERHGNELVVSGFVESMEAKVTQ